MTCRTFGEIPAACASLLVMMAVTIVPVQAAESASVPASRIKLHAQARALPAFTVMTAGGQPVTAAALAGRFTVLNIWATWCSPCLKELPSLDRLQQQLGTSVRVLAVSQDRGGADAVHAYLQRLGIRHLEVLYDRDTLLTTAFAVRVLPVTLILNKEGRELARFFGDLDWSDASVVQLLGQLASR